MTERTDSSKFATVSYAHAPRASPWRRDAVQHPRQPVYEIAEAEDLQAPGVGQLVFRRPVAALALVPRPVVLFIAGAIAGGIGKALSAVA